MRCKIRSKTIVVRGWKPKWGAGPGKSRRSTCAKFHEFPERTDLQKFLKGVSRRWAKNSSRLTWSSCILLHPPNRSRTFSSVFSGNSVRYGAQVHRPNSRSPGFLVSNSPSHWASGFQASKTPHRLCLPPKKKLLGVLGFQEQCDLNGLSRVSNASGACPRPACPA